MAAEMDADASRVQSRRLRVLFLALLALVIGAIVWSRRAATTTITPIDLANAPAPSSPDSPAAPEAHPLADHAERSTAVGTEPQVRFTGTSRADQLGDDELAGIVLNATNLPVAGAEIEVSRNAARDMDSLDAVYARQENVIARTRSDGTGHFSVRIGQARPHRLFVHEAGFARATFPACYAGEFITVHLQPPGRLVGRVTRLDDGTPIAEALVRVWTRERPWLELFRGDTDALGDFHVDDLGPEKIDLQVIPRAETVSPWIHIDLDAGKETRRDIALALGDRVVGRVFDSATGLPIAGAEVSDDWFFRRSVRSGPAGEFQLTGLSPNDTELAARAPGYARIEKAVPVDARESLHLDLALTRAHAVVGRVIDEQTIPLPEVYVAAVACDRAGDTARRSDWCGVRTDAAGNFHIQDLRPDIPHSLFLRKEGFGTAVFDFPPDEAVSSQIDLGDVILRPGSVLHGDVVDSGDSPIPGVEVSLSGCNQDRSRQGHEDEGEIDRYVARREVRTDSRGRFQFADLSAGRYLVGAIREQHPLGELHAVNVSSGTNPKQLRIRVEDGLAIQGMVVGPSSDPLPDVVIMLQSDPPDGHVFAVERNAADGTFLFLGLQPGTYRLDGDWNPHGEIASGSSLVRKARLTGIAAGSRALRLKFVRAITSAGVVRDSGGAPVGGATVVATDPSSELEYDRTWSDANGRFALATPETGLVRFLAQPPGDTLIQAGRPLPIEDPDLTTTTTAPSGSQDVALTLPRRT